MTKDIQELPKAKFAKYWDKQIPQIEVTNLDLPLFRKKEINSWQWKSRGALEEICCGGDIYSSIKTSTKTTTAQVFYGFWIYPMDLNKEKEGQRRTLMNTDEHWQTLMMDPWRGTEDLLMLFGQRSGLQFFWSTHGDAAAGVEAEDGGRRRRGSCRMRRCKEEERRRRRMEDDSMVLFLRRQENRQARKTRRPNNGDPANWTPQFLGRH